MRLIGVSAILLAQISVIGVPALADGPDMFNGRLQFERCGICHDAGYKRKDKQGPPLGGLFGRRAASTPGFAFSKALRAKKIVWTEATLDEFLKKPKAFIPGTLMVFGGIRKQSDRRDLIAYMKKTLAPAR